MELLRKCSANVLRMSSMNKQLILAATLAFGGFALTSCGGGEGTPQLQQPGNTTKVTVTNNGAQVSLSWTGVSGATSYQVQRSTGGATYTTVATVTTTTYTDTLPAPGVYTYKIRSVNSAGTSSGTASASVTYTAPPAIPTNPASVTVTPTTGGFTITWSASTGATSYILERQVNGGAFTQVATSTGTSYTDTGLAAGTYVYRVKAVSSAGTSSGTTSKTAVLEAAPANTSQARAQQFIGTWVMTYKIINTYTDTLKFNRVAQSTTTPGEYFAAGKDDRGNLIVGFYSNEYKTYVIGGGSSTLPTYYEFTSIASDGSIAGNVWFDLGDKFSSDYPLVGKRISTAIPALSVQNLNDSADAQRLYERLKTHR